MASLEDKLLKALDGQNISTGPQWYRSTERLLTCDKKVTFNQAVLDIGICTVDNFNKVLYAFREQKRYLRRHLIKSKDTKLHIFNSRLQELNAYLEAFPPDTEG